MDLKRLEGVIERHKERKTALISILHEIQDRHNHLPQEHLKRVAARLDMDLKDVYAVATFYRAFSLVPRGKHSLTLCLGTACHVRGGERILKEVSRKLQIGPGETTKDGKISLEAVNCLGVCAIGPVLMLDGKYYSAMTPFKAGKLIERIAKGRKEVNA